MMLKYWIETSAAIRAYHVGLLVVMGLDHYIKRDDPLYSRDLLTRSA